MKNNQKELRARLVELSSKYPDRQVVFYVPGELFAAVTSGCQEGGAN